MNSPLFKLNIKDLWQGFLAACTGAILSGAYQLVMDVIRGNTAFSTITATNICLAALSAGLLWLSKQLSTNSEGKLLKKEP